MSYGVGCRCSSDPLLLWLWFRPAAVAPIQPLAWEIPYVVGAALKKQKRKKPTDDWILKTSYRSSHCGAAEMNPTSIQEDVGLIPGLTQWVGDLAFLWFWSQMQLGSQIAMAIV